MKMMRHIAVTGIVVTLVMSLASCTVQTCYDDIDPLMNTTLLASGTGQEVKADTIVVTGVSPTDTIEFVNSKNVASFSVPLNPGDDVSTFYITISGTADTAVIYYARHPHLVAPECGYTILSEITGLRTTHNIIDTLIIENKSVNLYGETNLHLFF
jgi:hypothetical protein